MIKSNFPIDGTFLSSVIYEGILLCIANEFNFNNLKRDIYSKLNKIARERHKIILFKLEEIKNNKCIILRDFNKFKVKTSLKGKLPKHVILALRDVDKEELYSKLKDVEFLITNIQIAKALGNNVLDSIRSYIILEESAINSLKNIKNLPKNALIYKDDGKYYLYLGYYVLRHDIPTSGINDRYFFRYKDKGLEIQYNTKIFNESDYARQIGILTFLKSFIEEIKVQPKLDDIDISCKIEKAGSNKYKLSISGEDVTGLQIFGCDRFSGFTSVETDYTTSQVTIYTSPEVALVLLMGLASSFIVSIDNIYYFLFFLPEEISKLYFQSYEKLKNETIRKFFIVKEKVIEILREAYLRTSSNEITITELILNLELQELLSRYNLNKISFVLFKIALEGNTYKIYEQIPIAIHRKFAFREIIDIYFRNSDEFIKRLGEIFKNKRSRLWIALQNKDQSDRYPEGDNVLKAMIGLYRFIILGDLQGYYQFIREMFNCYQKSEHGYYKQILDRLKVF